MKWFTKVINAPAGVTVELEGIRTWTVRWESKRGNYPYTTKRPEVQMFTNKEDANHFAQSLRDAFKLIRHTAEADVVVEVQDE
jgi:hypothetical protein